MTQRTRLGVLVSGSGTNLQALLEATNAPDYPAEVAAVLSNVPGVQALERAAAAGVPTAVVEHGRFPSRDAFDARLVEVLREHRCELICLAGFMRLVGAHFLHAFPGRVLNIHPALLPAFPGLHGARQALAQGAKLAGCTVHFVDEGVDSGPTIAQAAVPVLPDDDEASLSARIQAQEHRLYPLAVRWVAEGRVTVTGRTARIRGAAPVGEALVNPGLEALR